MKKLMVLMLTFILFFTVFNITPQLKIQIVKADPITIYVPGDYSSIQAAINAANPGDTVFVYNGIYGEIINIDVEGLTIEGQDKVDTIIDAYYLGDAIEVSASNVIIKNFTIKNADGDGVIAENINNMAIENCIIENNGAYGIYLIASSNIISNCEIFENYYSGIRIGGSYYYETKNNTIINCEFYDNGYGGMYDNIKAAVSISPINGMVTNTTIVDCLFYCSFGYDVYVEGNTVENNMFYHNNFLSKTVTDNVYDSCNNIWYNQTIEEGNFWIDYTDKDNDGDGIGDTPYDILGGSNQDLYPLIDPLGLDRPVAYANGPYTANKGVAITFDASGSYDPDEDLGYPYLFYEWDLGNGDIRYGETVSYAYSSTGTYSVKLTVEDYHGLIDSDTTTAIVTGSSTTPPGGGSPPSTENTPPVADANGPFNGSVGIPVIFNGSHSYDDGEITNYTWDFGDNSYDYDIITTHIYEKVGVYNGKLTVTDDNGVNDTDSFKVYITHQPNNAPTMPQIDGPKTGKQNIDYNFTVFSTDVDNDTIQYVFYWGDDESDETDFLANGSVYIQTHKWTSPGIYKIKVVAIDSNYKSSDSAETYILIDVRYCKDIGYFIDEDSNGIYDTFYSNKTKIITNVVYENGIYFIDTDGNGVDNYIYNIGNDALAIIETEETDETADEENYTLFLIILLIVIILIVIILLAKRPKSKVEDKKDKPKEEKKPRTKKKIKVRKKQSKKKQVESSKKKSTTKKKGKKSK